MTLENYLDGYFLQYPSFCITYAEEDWPLLEARQCETLRVVFAFTDMK
jgi:hypothetical protein